MLPIEGYVRNFLDGGEAACMLPLHRLRFELRASLIDPFFIPHYLPERLSSELRK